MTVKSRKSKRDPDSGHKYSEGPAMIVAHNGKETEKTNKPNISNYK